MEFTKIDLRTTIYSVLYAGLFVIFMAFGNALTTYDTIFINYFHFHFLKYVLIFLGISFVGYLFLNNLDKIQKQLENLKVFPKFSTIFFTPNKKSFLYCFLFILCCHIPAFLAYFPGLFTYDTWYQVHFFVHHDYIEIHPILHTILVYWAVLINKYAYSEFLGVFIYTAIQVLIMISIYTYCIYYLVKNKYPFIFNFFALLFFALYPTNQVFPLVATKDVLFSGFVLLFVILMTKLTNNKNLINDNYFKTFFITTILLVFLFRHNGFYAYLLCLPLFLYYFRKNIKQTSILFLLPILLFGIIGFCKQLCEIKPAPIASSIGVPLQQMARVNYLHHNDLPDKEISDWENIVSPDKANIYTDYTVDTIKIDNEFLHSDFIEQSIKDNPKRFFSAYLNWFQKYPKDYVDAFMVLNKRYWYIKKKYKTYGLYCYLYTENRWSDFWGVKVSSKSFLPNVKDFYNEIFLKGYFDNIFSLTIYSMACNLWILIACCFILMYKKHYAHVIAILIIPALFLSVLFGPMALLRYIYQNFLILPLLFAFCLGQNNMLVSSK